MQKLARLICGFTWLLFGPFQVYPQNPPLPPKPLSGISVNGTANWQDLTVAEANFKAELPGKPLATSQTVESPLGKLPLRTWYVLHNKVQYHVILCEYPLAFDTPASAKDSLNGARDLTISQTAGKLLNETEINYGKFPGRDWKALTNRGLLQTRMFLVQQRLYALQATMPEQAAQDGTTQAMVGRFLASFKLLQEPTDLPAGVISVAHFQDNLEAKGLVNKLREHPTGWREYTSPQFGFKLQLPGEPAERTLSLNPRDPQLALQLLLARGEKLYCMVLSQRTQGGLSETGVRDLIFSELLNGLSEGFAKGAKGQVKLLSQTKFDLQGHPSEEYNLRVENADGVIGRGTARSYVIGNTVYMLSALAFGAATDSTEVTRFLDSFNLPNLPPPPTAAAEQDFTSTAGNFSVKLPGIRSEGIVPLETQLGKVEMRFVTGESLQGNFTVIYSDFPDFGAPDAFLDGVLKGLQQTNGVKLWLSRKATLKTEFGEFQGRVVSLQLPTGQTTQERFYLVNGRLYQLRVVGGASTEPKLTPQDFFDSFRLLQKPPKPAAPPPPPTPLPEPSSPRSAASLPPPPPPPMPKMREELIPSDAIKVSGGILQGMLATKKVQPEYPPIAKAAGADGPVAIQVALSETGELLDAVVLIGHPLLREAALAAARQWRFKGHQVDGKAVKAAGILVFNFTLQ